MKTYGAIEAGGTKFVLGIATAEGKVLERSSIPTTTPDETISASIAFFKEMKKQYDFEDIGIGTFGPVDLNPTSEKFGYITSTPKPGWKDTDFKGAVERALGVPVAFDTDVNAAALGEHVWGAAQDVDTFIYITIGTGLGGGVVVNGELLHGMLHPELGHIRIFPAELENQFEGVCPFHKHCFEGLAAGPGMKARWGQAAETLPADHEAWNEEAAYIAEGLANFVLSLSPQRIILGGGVMHQMHLFPMIREKLVKVLNGYVVHENLLGKIDDYVVPPGLGDNAGLLGAVALAIKATK